MVCQCKKADQAGKFKIYNTYLANTKWINNWDLVDTSAYNIVGPQIDPDYKSVLTKLAKSNDLWEKRIAMVACFHFIRNSNPAPGFYVMDILKDDPHDLLQKAVGWMLRETGKRCGREVLLDWLLTDQQYTKLPRTTLRYAIEHFDQADRKAFLQGHA